MCMACPCTFFLPVGRLVSTALANKYVMPTERETLTSQGRQPMYTLSSVRWLNYTIQAAAQSLFLLGFFHAGSWLLPLYAFYIILDAAFIQGAVKTSKDVDAFDEYDKQHADDCCAHDDNDASWLAKGLAFAQHQYHLLRNPSLIYEMVSWYIAFGEGKPIPVIECTKFKYSDFSKQEYLMIGISVAITSLVYGGTFYFFGPEAICASNPNAISVTSVLAANFLLQLLANMPSFYAASEVVKAAEFELVP